MDCCVIRRPGRVAITCEKMFIEPTIFAVTQPPIMLKVRRATSTSEYRAAAFLRAQSFLNLPKDRSEYARRSYFRMKADETWKEIEGGPVTLLPIIATSLEEPSEPGAYLDASAMSIPTAERIEWIIGTLDINIGPKLPCEELIGFLPDDNSARTKRAYLSNVCVLPATRRRGVAATLIESASEIARSQGVDHLYVHVVAENEAARQLYMARCEFALEQEEREAFARGLNRPRRLLLHKALGK